MKKNLITIFSLAVLTAFSMPVTVCADTTITQDSEPKTAEMTVSYTVEPSYTVTIPASVDLQIGSSTSAEVKVENVCIPYGKSVNVIISNANPTPDVDKFHVQSGTNVLDYKISKDGTGSAISVNSEIIYFECPV